MNYAFPRLIQKYTKMQTSQDYIFHILKGDVPIVHRGSYNI